MAEYEREFASELKEVVTAIGDEKGYTYILSDITILYSDPAYDLTDDAIAALKEKTEKRPGKSSSEDK
jgi:Skp family chaperone for outer membrane proteins